MAPSSSRSWLRHIFIAVVAAVLATAGTSPALAAEQSNGLELARDAAFRAIELASGPVEDSDDAATSPPDAPGATDPGAAGKAKGQAEGKGKGKAEGNPGNNSEAPGNRGDSEKLTGRDRAAAAIAEAFERSNGNGNGFGRGHAVDVIEKLLAGESPATLSSDENHGAQVSAMVTAYNELRSRLGGDG